MPCLYILAGFIALGATIGIIGAISNIPHKKAKKFIEECFLQFVGSSPQLPKYHKSKQELLRWKLWYIEDKTEPLRFDEYTGQKLGGGTPFHLVTCSSVDYITSGSDSCTVDSDHVFKIKLSDAEYAKAIDRTLSPEILIQKFIRSKMSTKTFYC